MKIFMIALIALSLSLQGCLSDKGMRGDFEAFKVSQNKNWGAMNKYINLNEKKRQDMHDEVESLKTYLTDNLEQISTDTANLREDVSELQSKWPTAPHFEDAAEPTTGLEDATDTSAGTA